MWQYFKAIRPAPGFHVDQPPSNVSHSAELFATIRNNGRILDDVRCVLGGNEVVEASFQLGKLMENPDFKEYEIKMQKWPRDIELRKGLVSGAWTSLSDLIAARDADVYNKDGSGIPANEFLQCLQEAEGGAEETAVRWAVVINDCEKMALQLQGLPAAANVLNGKPSLRR
jgi:hypothetical protein